MTISLLLLTVHNVCFLNNYDMYLPFYKSIIHSKTTPLRFAQIVLFHLGRGENQKSLFQCKLSPVRVKQRIRENHGKKEIKKTVMDAVSITASRAALSLFILRIRVSMVPYFFVVFSRFCSMQRLLSGGWHFASPPGFRSPYIISRFLTRKGGHRPLRLKVLEI